LFYFLPTDQCTGSPRLLTEGTTLQHGTHEPSTVLIVDDHQIVRGGLVRILEEKLPGLEAIPCGGSEAALLFLQRQRVQLVLLDLTLPGLGGLQLLRSLRGNGNPVPILIFTANEDPTLPARMRLAGAQGFLCKTESSETLIEVVSALLRGGSFFPGLDTPRSRSIASDLSPEMRLSEREREVLEALMAGSTLSDIAGKLGISPNSVSTYKKRLFQKLDVDTLPELVRRVVAEELL